MDGTLAYTERRGHRVAFNRAFSEARLDQVREEALSGALSKVADGKARFRHFIATHHFGIRGFEADPSILTQRLHTGKTFHYSALPKNGGISARQDAIRSIQSENSLRSSPGAELQTPVSVNDCNSGQDFTGASQVIDPPRKAGPTFNVSE